MDAKWNSPITKGQMLDDSTHLRFPEHTNFQRQKVEWWMLRLGSGEGESVFSADTVSVWGDEKVLEVDGGDSCPTR